MSKKNLLNESQIRQFMKLARLEPLTPGFVQGLNETTDEDLEESHGRGQAELNQSPAPHRGGGDASMEEGMGGMYRDEDEEAQEHDLEDAEHDMDHADDLEKDAAEDLGDIGDDDGGRMIAVDDFLSALESALESALGDEVEIDASDMDVEDEEEVEVADVDMGDEAGMEMDVEVEDEMLDETGAKRDGESAGDKGKDKEDPEDRDYSGHGMRKHDKSDTDPGDEDDTWRKGKKSKTHAGLNKEGTEATDELVEQITKRVAARILKSALTKK